MVLSVSSGRDASGREPLRASAEAPSVTEAMQRLQGLSRSDELFFSGTGCILIGEAAAAQTARWLELVARSDSLRLDTPLFIVRGGEAEMCIRDRCRFAVRAPQMYLEPFLATEHRRLPY